MYIRVRCAYVAVLMLSAGVRLYDVLKNSKCLQYLLILRSKREVRVILPLSGLNCRSLGKEKNENRKKNRNGKQK